MKLLGTLVLVTMATATAVFAANEDKYYKLGPDSIPQDGVPKGKLIGPTTLPCQVYRGRSTLTLCTCRRSMTQSSRRR